MKSKIPAKMYKVVGVQDEKMMEIEMRLESQTQKDKHRAKIWDIASPRPETRAIARARAAHVKNPQHERKIARANITINRAIAHAKLGLP